METTPTYSSHLLFKLQIDDAFVLDPLMSLCELQKCPALKHKSRFRSAKMLERSVESILQPQCHIHSHQFDLLSDTLLVVKLASDTPLQFDKSLLHKLYADSNLCLYIIRQAVDQNIEIVNQMSGKVLKVTPDAASFNSMMKLIFPFWAEIFMLDYQNNVKRINDRVKMALILDQFDALMKYARSRSHDKELCWME